MIVPTIVPPITERKPTASEMRAPKMTRLMTSRPMLSVPNGCPQLGFWKGTPADSF
jgi:hypothetical protein